VNSHLSHVVAEVIRNASRNKPADAALREKLRAAAGLSPADATEVSLAVFTYYRWRNWLVNESSITAKIRRSLELADRFRKNPFTLPMEILRAKSVPEWLAGEVEGGDEWYRSLQREPKLWLRARPGQGRALAKKLGHARSLYLPETVVYEGRKDLFQTAEFHAGEFEVQDLSSQAVGRICDPKPGETWWDACAGEGGKTLHLADLMENKGLIWATDRAAWRLQRLRRRAGRAKLFNYRAVIWTGGPELPTRTVFDGVLVDAPCSGVGTWQRNPHARWTTTLDDVRELSAMQKQLVVEAAKAVKPGGKMIYAVCTLTRSETVEVADEFERQCPEFAPLPAANPLFPEQPASVRIWIRPEQCGGNGMFVAQWQKADSTTESQRKNRK
jgi:16S rRNA (cytosine967-C5)-methyltransferase